MHRIRTMLILGLTLLASAAALFAGAANGPAHAATASVDVDDNFFEDALSGNSTTTVNVGDSVQWTWVGQSSHSVTADDNSFDSNPPLGFQSSGTFSHTFNTPGTFEYYCRVHSSADGNSMNGIVIVQAASTNTPGATNTSQPTGTRTPTRTATAVATGTGVATSTPAPAGTSTTAAPAAATATRAGGGVAPVISPVAGSGPDRNGFPTAWLAIALAGAGVAALTIAGLTSRKRL